MVSLLLDFSSSGITSYFQKGKRKNKYFCPCLSIFSTRLWPGVVVFFFWDLRNILQRVRKRGGHYNSIGHKYQFLVPIIVSKHHAEYIALIFSYERMFDRKEVGTVCCCGHVVGCVCWNRMNRGSSFYVSNVDVLYFSC